MTSSPCHHPRSRDLGRAWPTLLLLAAAGALASACGSSSATTQGTTTSNPSAGGGPGGGPGGAGGGAGGTDVSAGFVKTWYGTTVLASSGQSQTVTTTQPITSVGVNEVAITRLCPDGGDIDAAVTSATAFTVTPATCPTFTVKCPDGSAGTRITRVSGTGTLTSSGVTLTLHATLDVSACGSSAEVDAVFTGTDTPPVPSKR